MTKLVKPQPGERCNDPACGTFGFMISASQYVRSQTDDFFDLDADMAKFEREEAFTGCELVHDTHRLALMNAMLHVLFFTRGKTDKHNTKEVWIYDLRNEMPSFGKTNPLKSEHFDDFMECYADGDLSKRKETYSEENPNGRWRKFTIEDILARDKTSLDITWMKSDSGTDDYTLAELLDMIKEKSSNIAKAVAELEALIGEVEE